MNKIEKLAILFVEKQKNNEVSLQRLNNIIYMYDWIHILMFEEVFTNIDWRYNNCMLDISNLLHVTSNSRHLELVNDENSTIRIVKLFKNSHDIRIDSKQYRLLEHINHKTKDLTYFGILSHMHSTFPIQQNERCEKLDLSASAKKFKAELANSKCRTLIPPYYNKMS